MAHTDSRSSLLVLGVHLKSEGYPNTLYRLRDLEASKLFRMAEINVPMWDEKTQNRHGFARLSRNILRAAFAHLAVISRYLAYAKPPERVYVPYPGVFVLFMLSWLPAWYRPRYIVADVFISLYDTIVLDRCLLRNEGLPARILKRIERRAYVYADKLVVDTPQNARFICSLFELSESKLVAVPLSTDEAHFKYTPYQPTGGICRVLFVGTMVPLHGIETILEAASLLKERHDIHFKLIGDGQDAPIVEAWQLRAHMSHLEWERAWQPSNRIAEEVSRADICLGIFGAGDKAQRVCPFKIYAYASMGRAVITGDTLWLREATQAPHEAFASVPVNDAGALAEKIIQLANAPLLRAQLAVNSRQYYEGHLSNRAGLKQLAQVFANLGELA